MSHTLSDGCQTFEFRPAADSVTMIRRAPQPVFRRGGIKPGALEACRALAEGGEAVEANDDVLYFWFPNGQGESGIFRKATPRMLGMGTGRNWNTVLKLADMAGAKT